MVAFLVVLAGKGGGGGGGKDANESGFLLVYHTHLQSEASRGNLYQANTTRRSSKKLFSLGKFKLWKSLIVVDWIGIFSVD